MLNRSDIVPVFVMSRLFRFHLVDPLLEVCFQLCVVKVCLPDCLIRRDITGSGVIDQALHKCRGTGRYTGHDEEHHPDQGSDADIYLPVFLEKVGNFAADLLDIVNRADRCSPHCLLTLFCLGIFLFDPLFLDQLLQIRPFLIYGRFCRSLCCFLCLISTRPAFSPVPPSGTLLFQMVKPL